MNSPNFETELATLRPRLVRFAIRIVGPDYAEECVQQGTLKAWLALESFRGECKFSSWLTGIVKNECLGHLRKHPDIRNNELDTDMADPLDLSAMTLGSITADRMMSAVSGLPPKYRNVVMHRLKGGALVQPTAKAQMCRARVLLRETPVFRAYAR